MLIGIIVLSIVLFLACITIIILSIVIGNIAKDETQTKIELYNVISKTAPKQSTVFLGDSITEFFRISEIFSSISLHNRGIAGDTTTGVMKRLEKNVLEMNPQKVFLMIGTNDLGKKKKPNEIIQNIIQIIETIKAYNAETQIILWSICPVNKKVTLPLSRFMVGKRNNEQIDYINQQIEAYAKEHQYIYVDTNTPLKDEKGNLKKEFTYEGLHLTYPAYLEIAKLLEPYIA